MAPKGYYRKNTSRSMRITVTKNYEFIDKKKKVFYNKI